MKICGKKLIAGAAALAMAMACSPIGGFAAENSVLITNIEILNDGSDTAVASYAPTDSGIKLTTAQLMRVTAELKDSTPANIAGEISFLSNFGGENVTLDNSTIQYVDQQTYDGTTAVTITFRPRTTINNGGIGTFVAKAGGTDVAIAATFNYSVEAPKSNMTFTATTPTSIKPNQTVSFTLKDGETNVEGATVSAAVAGGTPINAVYADGVYTITFAEAGTYTVTATKEGYNTPTTIMVSVVENTTVPEEEKEAVTNSLKEGLNGVEQGKAESTLPDKAGAYNISYTIDATEGKVNKTDNKLSLVDGVFAAKVIVNANIGETISEQKVIYLVRDNTKNISFGNLALISTTAGEDAFASTEKLTAANVDDVAKNAIKVEALNYALDRAVPISAIKSAIDYDMNNDVTLSEYRMLKLLFEGNENFTADKLTAQRSSWLSQQP